MNESILFHRGNESEWRFVGIWADMLDKSILELDQEDVKDFLVLFKEYDSPLLVLQENLHLYQNRCYINALKLSQNFEENAQFLKMPLILIAV